jgi:hypothetical protein
MEPTAPPQSRETVLTWVVLVGVMSLVFWAIATYLG